MHLPGVIETPLVLNSIGQAEGALQRLAKMHPLGRNAQPIEIAHAVLFLASDDSSFITGHALAIDGGITAGLGTNLD